MESFYQHMLGVTLRNIKMAKGLTHCNYIASMIIKFIVSTAKFATSSSCSSHIHLTWKRLSYFSTRCREIVQKTFPVYSAVETVSLCAAVA